MVDRFLLPIANLVGHVVYGVSKPVLWTGWNFVGKHVVRAFQEVSVETERSEVDRIVAEGASSATLRRLVATAYYNRLLVERDACARSA